MAAPSVVVWGQSQEAFVVTKRLLGTETDEEQNSCPVVGLSLGTVRVFSRDRLKSVGFMCVSRV